MDSKCISFDLRFASASKNNQTCTLSGWSDSYALEDTDKSSLYYFRLRRLDNSSVTPAVSYSLEVPNRWVQLLGTTAFSASFAANIIYLSQFPVDDLLYWFRMRAGIQQPVDAQSWGWDCGTGKLNKSHKCRMEGGLGLKGSVAGAFLMGTGGAVRWPIPDMGTNAARFEAMLKVRIPDLKARMVDVVTGIEECKQSNGYIMAFEQNRSNMHEVRLHGSVSGVCVRPRARVCVVVCVRVCACVCVSFQT
jgi:hypothetical protein